MDKTRSTNILYSGHVPGCPQIPPENTSVQSEESLAIGSNSVFIHNMSYQNGGQDSEVTGIGLCLQNTSYFDLEKMSVYQN